MATTSKSAKAQLLLSLAALSTNDGLSHLKSFSGFETAAGTALAEALARKKAKEKEEVAEAAADEILRMFKESDRVIDNHRETYKQLRRSMDAHKNAMETIAVARLYGEETMNFLPLSAALGEITNREILDLSEEDKVKLVIPKADRDRLVKKLAEARKKADAA